MNSACFLLLAAGYSVANGLAGLRGEVETLTRACAGAAVSGLWQGLLLALVAGTLLRLMPRTTATLRFAVWSAVLLAVTLLPLLHKSGVIMPSQAQSWLRVSSGWSVAVAVVWLVVSTCRLAGLVFEATQLRKVWRMGKPIVAAPEVQLLLEGAWGRRIELCVSETIDRPSVIGFFSPRILVPAWLNAELSPAELYQVVLHEVEHLRRGDDWLNLLQKLALALFPLNPVLVWVERRLCTERELACDDGVLRSTGAPRVYARCLTSLAERRLARLERLMAVSLALGAVGRRPELAKRVHRILSGPAGLSPMWARVAAGLLVLALTGGSVELARAPELVSFSGPSRATTAQEVAAPLVRPVPGEREFRVLDTSFHERTSHPQNVKTGSRQQSSRNDWAIKGGVRARGVAPVKRIEVLQVSSRGGVLRRAVYDRGDSSGYASQLLTRLVMTSWEEQAEDQPQALSADSAGRVPPAKRLGITWITDEGSPEQNFRGIHRYAAVPSGSGWLVFEL